MPGSNGVGGRSPRPLRDLARARLRRRGPGSSRRNVAGERLAAARRARSTAPPIGRERRAHHLVEPALLEHQPLEAALEGDAALEHLVLLVDERVKAFSVIAMNGIS